MWTFHKEGMSVMGFDIDDKKVHNLGIKMKAYDPEAIGTFKKAASKEALESIEFTEDRDTVLEGVDALVICTEWNEFRRPTLEKFSEMMKDPVIFDGHYLYDLKRAEEAGLT